VVIKEKADKELHIHLKIKKAIHRQNENINKELETRNSGNGKYSN
jgi:hypothetical protein